MASFKACLNCPDRTGICHDSCERYLAEVAKNNHERNRARSDREYKEFKNETYNRYCRTHKGDRRPRNNPKRKYTER